MNIKSLEVRQKKLPASLLEQTVIKETRRGGGGRGKERIIDWRGSTSGEGRGKYLSGTARGRKDFPRLVDAGRTFATAG